MNTENPKPEIVEQLNKVLHCVEHNDPETAKELVLELISAMAGGTPSEAWKQAAFPLKEFELSFRTACRKHNNVIAAYMAVLPTPNNAFGLRTGGHAKAVMLLTQFLNIAKVNSEKRIITP